MHNGGHDDQKSKSLHWRWPSDAGEDRGPSLQPGKVEGDGPAIGFAILVSGRLTVGRPRYR